MSVLNFKHYVLVLAAINLSINFSSVSSIELNNPEPETKEKDDHVQITKDHVNDNENTTGKTIISDNLEESTTEFQRSLYALHEFLSGIKHNENTAEYSHQLDAARDYLNNIKQNGNTILRVRRSTAKHRCMERRAYVKLPISLQLIQRQAEDGLTSENHDESTDCTVELKSLGFTGERDNDYMTIKYVRMFQDILNKQQAEFHMYQKLLNDRQQYVTEKPIELNNEKQQQLDTEQKLKDECQRHFNAVRDILNNVYQNENTTIKRSSETEDEWECLHDESMTEEDEWTSHDESTDEERGNDSTIIAYYARRYQEILDKNQEEFDTYQELLNDRQRYGRECQRAKDEEQNKLNSERQQNGEKRQKKLDDYQVELNEKLKNLNEKQQQLDAEQTLKNEYQRHLDALSDFLKKSKLNGELRCVLINAKLMELENQEISHDMDEEYARLQNYIGYVESNTGTNSSDDTNFIPTFCTEKKINKATTI